MNADNEEGYLQNPERTLAEEQAHLKSLEESVVNSVDRIIEGFNELADLLESTLFSAPSENDLLKKTDADSYARVLL